jgi:hypothetical protein
VAVTPVSATLGILLGSITSLKDLIYIDSNLSSSTIARLVMAKTRSEIFSQGDPLLTCWHVLFVLEEVNRYFNVVETTTMRPLSIAAILEAR